MLLLSAVQWRVSAMCVCVCVFTLPCRPPSHLPPLPTHLGCHRASSWAPCTIQQVPTSYLFFTSLLLFSHSVVSDSLPSHALQHTRLCCPSLSPWVCSNSCPLNRWYHPTISSSPPSPYALNLSQPLGLFQWVSSSHQVAKVLELPLQHQSFQ